jgi:hypothetical protein
VYEHVIAAFNLDESKTFFCVKPFYCSCLHGYDLHSVYLHDFSFSVTKIKIHILEKAPFFIIATLYNM